MATLGELRTRIVTETNRDDLLDTLSASLDLCIQQAIEYYADTRFWFNELRTTSVAAANVEYLPYPTGLRFLDELFIIVGGVRYNLRKLQNIDIESLYSVPLIGQPTDFAEYVGQARLWPTTNISYTFIWLGVASVTPALDYTNPLSTNAWLSSAYDLIDARARYLLYRDYFRDDGGMAIASNAETQALDNLKTHSNRLMGTGRVRPSW